MNKVSRLLFRREKELLLVLTSILWIGLYFIVDAAPHLMPAVFVPWDPVWRLPFVSAFVIPYLSLYVMPLVLLIAPDDRRFFRRLTVTVIAAMTISNAVFLLLPLDLPRVAPTDGGPLEALVGFIYAADARGNFFPSQHVILACLMALGVGRLQPAWRLPMIAWAALISASTVLIKQHYCVDVAAGVATALLTWGGLKVYEKSRST